MAKQDKAPKLTAAQKAKAASDAHKTIARNKRPCTTTPSRKNSKLAWP